MTRKDCVLLDQPDILRVLFYPRRDSRPGFEDGGDIFFPLPEGIRLSGRLHVADRISPLILLFHGNGEIASDYDDIALLYTRMGISLLVVDYRGYGKSDGSPTASALLDDAIEVFRFLPDILSNHGLGDSPLFIMGRSLGSAAAIEIAAQAGDNIIGLIIESGFADTLRLIERLKGAPVAQQAKDADGFNNAEKIQRVKVPTLIIHGQADQIIPVTDGKTLYNQCGAKAKRLVIIPEAGHNDLLYRGQGLYFDAVREFVLA